VDQTSVGKSSEHCTTLLALAICGNLLKSLLAEKLDVIRFQDFRQIAQAHVTFRMILLQ
jgi:hypothetical protein